MTSHANAYREVLEHHLEHCQECQEDISPKLAQYPDATWHWVLACSDHVACLKTLAEQEQTRRELEHTIPILERIAKGKALMADPKLPMNKVIQYTNAIKDLEAQLPIGYKKAVIETLRLQLDTIYTDMILWLKPS